MATNPREIGALTRAVAAELRVLIAERQLRKDLLAADAGLSAATLSKMVAGKSAIDIEQIDRIAGALEISPSALMDAAIARRNRTEAEEGVELGAREDVYLPDGTINPAIGGTVPTTPEHREELRKRKRS